MSAALLDDLLAGYVAPVRFAFAAPTLAKAAKAANRELPRDPAPALAVCEGMRIPANPAGADAEISPGSQTFAGIRKPETGPRSEQTFGSSQDSQDSHGCPLQSATADGWSDANISAFIDRHARLLRWGWAEPEAEKLAERLVKHDRENDVRVSCTDCAHYRPGRCGNHSAAGLHSAELGRDLAATLQRCPGFQVGT